MTAAQLIDRLKELPPALPVRVRAAYFTITEDGHITEVEDVIFEVQEAKNEASHVMLA